MCEKKFVRINIFLHVVLLCQKTFKKQLMKCEFLNFYYVIVECFQLGIAEQQDGHRFSVHARALSR